MSMAPNDNENIRDGDVDSQSASLTDQLRKDVASWSAARSGRSARETAERGVPVTRQPALPPVRRAPPSSPASPQVKPASSGKKPFGMSYDGVTETDYITYMLARGAR